MSDVDLRYAIATDFTAYLLSAHAAVEAGDRYIVASGEADLACRITHISKQVFA